MVTGHLADDLICGRLCCQPSQLSLICGLIIGHLSCQLVTSHSAIFMQSAVSILKTMGVDQLDSYYVLITTCSVMVLAFHAGWLSGA